MQQKYGFHGQAAGCIYAFVPETSGMLIITRVRYPTCPANMNLVQCTIASCHHWTPVETQFGLMIIIIIMLSLTYELHTTLVARRSNDINQSPQQSTYCLLRCMLSRLPCQSPKVDFWGPLLKPVVAQFT